jgi:hypothetical protein
MSELSNVINNFSGKNLGLHVIQFPSGKYGYVGTVPIDLAFIDPTPEQVNNLQFGERFGPKKRTFENKDLAITYAKIKGYKVIE